MPHPPDLALSTTIRRGLTGRCPACGKGRLFQSYLKAIDQCEHCGEALGHIRADDGPAWLTILIIGPLLVPIVFAMIMWDGLPNWLSISVLISLGIGLVLVILPRVKGLFLALLWTGQIGDITAPPD